jgi:ferritin-like metal-binding protein YciE
MALFEKLNTPEEIFSFKLGAALSMEKTVLDTLEDVQKETNRAEVRQLAEAHAAESQRHVERIEEAFRLLGEDVDDSPCPAMQGIQKEGKATLKKIDDPIKDAGVFAGMIETEHHEIAVYEILVTNAEARGATEVAALLQQNLDEEQRMLDTVEELAGSIAKGEGYAVAT